MTTQEEKKQIEEAMSNPVITNMFLDYAHGGPGWREDHVKDFVETRQHVSNMDLLRSHIVCQRCNLTDEEIKTLDFDALVKRYYKYPHEKQEDSNPNIPQGAVLGNIIRPILVDMWDKLAACSQTYADYKNRSEPPRSTEHIIDVWEDLINKGSVAIAFFVRIRAVIEALNKEAEMERAKETAVLDEMLDRIKNTDSDALGEAVEKLFGKNG